MGTVNFAFYNAVPLGAESNIRQERSLRRRQSIMLSNEELANVDRGGYAEPRFAFMQICVGAVAPRPDLGLSTRCVRRVRGNHKCQPQLMLVTVAEMSEADSAAFLLQFDAASAVMTRQIGFGSARLFAQSPTSGSVFFVNIAHWEDFGAFMSAFSSADFKKTLRGGFEAKCSIMSTRIYRNTDAGIIQ